MGLIISRTILRGVHAMPSCLSFSSLVSTLCQHHGSGKEGLGGGGSFDPDEIFNACPRQRRIVISELDLQAQWMLKALG
jgi:hypothetical protein